jgi:predicted  nucleic acid-binding Zn-ribbon protein
VGIGGGREEPTGGMTMASPAAIFREIHRLRKHAKDLQTEIERVPKMLKAQQNRVTQREAGGKDAQDGLKRLKVQCHEKEVLLKQAQQQVAKHQKQLQEAGAKKEYDALKSEIQQEQEHCRRLEDEILATMMEIEECTGALPGAEKAAKQAKLDYDEFEKNSEARKVVLLEQLNQALQSLKEVEAGLPEELALQYRRAVAARNEDALSAVQGRTCVACYTEITAQSYNDLLSGRVVVCKACGRILYLPE